MIKNTTTQNSILPSQHFYACKGSLHLRKLIHIYCILCFFLYKHPQWERHVWDHLI